MSVSRRAATSAFQRVARRAQSSDNKAPEKVTSSYLAHKYPRPLTTKQFGVDILHDPLWNKGLSFDHSERDRLGIRGLLPPAVRSLEDQVQRSMRRLKAMGDNNVQQNLYLQELHNRNETLYHRVIIEDVEMIAPLIYTPTVGAVCEKCTGWVCCFAVLPFLRSLTSCSPPPHPSQSGTNSVGHVACTSAKKTVGTSGPWCTTGRTMTCT